MRISQALLFLWTCLPDPRRYILSLTCIFLDKAHGEVVFSTFCGYIDLVYSINSFIASSPPPPKKTNLNCFSYFVSGVSLHSLQNHYDRQKFKIPQSQRNLLTSRFLSEKGGAIREKGRVLVNAYHVRTSIAYIHIMPTLFLSLQSHGVVYG